MRQLSLICSNVLAFPLLLVVSLFLRAKKTLKHSRSTRIFIGIREIAENIGSIQHTLCEVGKHCDVLIIPNEFYDVKPYQCNCCTLKKIENGTRISMFCQELLLPFFLLPYLLKDGIFIFVWSKTFMFFSLDLLFIKMSGKKLVFVHCGDDVRYRPLQRYIDAEFGLSTWPNESIEIFSLISKLYYQRLCEKTGLVISTRDQATFQGSKLYHFQFPQKRILNSRKQARESCLILHCPSNKMVKGTEIVLEAIQILELQNSLDFKFELIENRNNDYVKRRLLEADVVIDQPGVWAARLAVEAMASGCCVVGGNRAEYMERIPSPIIQFEKSPIHLANTLKALITNKEFRQNKMNECFDFWENHYSIESYTHYFNNILEGKAAAFEPLANQKEILLQHSSTSLSKLIIKLAYYPVNAR